MPTQMNLPILVAEAVEAELARNPDKYRSVTPGPKGDSLTLVSVVTEADFSLTMTFSDGTVYHSPPVRGVQGDDGIQGERGPRGVGIHHTRWSATTNPEHHFGVAGHMDTYTLYGDEEESVVLGWFSVKNGADGKDSYDYAVEGGYEGTKEEFYDAIAENASNFEEIRDLIAQSEELFTQVETKGQEFIDEINQIIADFLALKGKPGGFASLDDNGKIPLNQLPADAEKLQRVNHHSDLPYEGETHKLYLVVQDETADNLSTLYHWVGFEYRPVTSSVFSDAFKGLSERVGTLETFREVVFSAHKLHLPDIGEEDKLYVVKNDETSNLDFTLYIWHQDAYVDLLKRTLEELTVGGGGASAGEIANLLGRIEALEEEVTKITEELEDADLTQAVVVVQTENLLPAPGKEGVIYVVKNNGGTNLPLLYIYNGQSYVSMSQNISAAAGNAIENKADGLYVPTFENNWTQKEW